MKEAVVGFILLTLLACVAFGSMAGLSKELPAAEATPVTSVIGFLGRIKIEPNAYWQGLTHDGRELAIFGWEEIGDILCYDTHIGGKIVNDVPENDLCQLADCGQRFGIVRMDEATSTAEPVATLAPTATPKGAPPPTQIVVVKSAPDGQRRIEVTLYETPCPPGVYGRAYYPVTGFALVGLVAVIFGVLWVIRKLKG